MYGSQWQVDDRGLYSFPIVDEADVNKRRAEVNLESLEVHMARTNDDKKQHA